MDSRVLADWYWGEILETNPLLGTEVGDDRFDDRLPDLSPEGIERRREIHATALGEARKLRESDGDFWNRAICDTIVSIAGPEVEGVDLGLYRFTPVDHLWGPASLLDQLGSLQVADTTERAARYLRRLQGIASYLDACGRVLLDDLAGPTAPRIIVDRCLRQVQEILASNPEDSSALRPIPSSDGQARTKASDILRTSIVPAYSRYLDGLRAYRERARDTIGLLHVPGGDAMYRVCIQRWTSLTLDPRDVHEMGRIELDQIQNERRQVAEGLGAPDPASAIARYNATGQNGFRSREEMLGLAEEQVQRGWDGARGFFGRLPRRNCEVRPVDPSREADVGEHYFPGTSDGSRPGIYYVNTARPQQRLRHTLASITFHEANPGHHFQISLEQEQPDRPALLRFGGELAASAFVEGWGLYAERLADEMGLFVDEYERLGMLELQAFRAARLIVDTGLHALGWSRRRAIRTLETTGLDPRRAGMETDRYIAMPGQALAYKIGQMEIERSRRRAERQQGRRFSLRDFHDRLLALGSLPLGTLRREVSSAAPDGDSAPGATGRTP